MEMILGGLLYDVSKDEDGNWIYKSKGKARRKDGTLKAKYKDLPRYKALQEIEDEFKKEFEQDVLKDFIEGFKKDVDQFVVKEKK